MSDREITIKGLNPILWCARQEKWGAWTETLEDAIELLKEQEAKQVNISQTHCGMKYGLCPRCEKQIDTLVNPHYCGNCGQELKWE